MRHDGVTAVLRIVSNNPVVDCGRRGVATRCSDDDFAAVGSQIGGDSCCRGDRRRSRVCEDIQISHEAVIARHEDLANDLQAGDGEWPDDDFATVLFGGCAGRR